MEHVTTKLLLIRSDRVKCIDFHPVEPWILTALYSGDISIWNYCSQKLLFIKHICEVPLRCAKFIAQKAWIVAGSDDGIIYVISYKTQKKVHEIKAAHEDFIRSLVVHRTQPFVLTCGDDTVVKLWDYSTKWRLKKTFKGHKNFVMCVALSTKCEDTFATASLDGTVKIWQLGSSQANITLEGHPKGAICVDYYHGSESYLASGGEDGTLKIWNYESKTCVISLDGHFISVTSLSFVTSLPVLISGSPNSKIFCWNIKRSRNWEKQEMSDYGLGRTWSINAAKCSNIVALGFDEGCLVLKIGSEFPPVSMDRLGRVIFAKEDDICLTDVRKVRVSKMNTQEDIYMVPTSSKSIGTSEVYPQILSQNSNGRFFVVVGFGDYVIYSNQFILKDYGKCSQFVWCSIDPTAYAILSDSREVRVYRNFVEIQALRIGTVDSLFGGPVLTACSSDLLHFQDWKGYRITDRVKVVVNNVYWSEDLKYVAVVGEGEVYIVEIYAPCDNKMTKYIKCSDKTKFNESVVTGIWIGACFVFTTRGGRIVYFIGKETHTLTYYDESLYIIGFIREHSRLYLCDVFGKIFAYNLPLKLMDYMTAIMQDDFKQVMPNVSSDERNQISRLLVKKGRIRRGLLISTDERDQFKAAIILGNVNTAYEIAEKLDCKENWLTLGDLYSSCWDIKKAIECFIKGKDYSTAFLIATSAGLHEQLAIVASASEAEPQSNISFLAYLLLGDFANCLKVLTANNRLAEAVFFAYCYCPEEVERTKELWARQMQLSPSLLSLRP